ncbi:MAG: MarC family protein [Desulfobulbaceae bacterium]|nr:MarC family protein [Desulfobulbaceae bacterium]
MTLLSAALLLFLVMDPVGNIPLYLVTLQGYAADRQRRIIIRELLFALTALILFLFSGQFLLKLLNISESALTMAGGIILFLIAIKMIFPATMGTMAQDMDIEGEPFIVPLAIPFIAGPSALAAVLFIVSRDTARWPEWLGAILLAWLASGIILFAANHLSSYLGKRGIIAIERLMGMILTAIAVEMIMNGINQFLLCLP